MGTIDRLNQHDMITGATPSQYKQIAKISGVDPLFFVESAIARGGCFWSDRYNIPIPGKLSHGKTMEVNEFINRLKAMKS